MKLILALALTLSSALSFSAVNHEGTCSQLTKVCAIYHTDAPFTTTQEARFKLFLESSDQKEVQFVKADLWMQMGNHGHGSSPLKITPIAPGEFDVTKAYFVMKGKWQIRVTYEQDSKQETLIIPVTIKE
jgi:hypothetical protein